MALRTYGEIKKTHTGWRITKIEPHVAIKLKNVFPRIPKHATLPFDLVGGPDLDTDLVWFLSRYPMQITELDSERMARGKASFLQTQAEIVQILSADWKPSEDTGFRKGESPYPFQAQAAEMARRLGCLLVGDDVGQGKEQPNHTRVLTPQGWRTMGDLKVGDHVIGSNGLPKKVTGVFPQGVKPIYRVTFWDHSSVEAGGEHLWTVRYWCGGKRISDLLLTTDQIRRGDKIELTHSRGTVKKTVLDLSKPLLYLPMLSAPVVFQKSNGLPLPPYLLGALIANGYLCGCSCVLTTHKDDANHFLSKIDKKFRGKQTTKYCNSLRLNVVGIKKIIDCLGLNVKSRRKFIPKIYLRASPKQRIELLHGLMDSDGSISKERNRVTYHTTSAQLAKDVQELVEQLGGIASIIETDRQSEGKSIEYAVRVRLPDSIPPFSLRRKLERFTASRGTRPQRTFRKVEYVGDFESTCISVAAVDQLYVTEHSILTHNTVTAIATLSQDKQYLPAMIVVQPHLSTQWQEKVREFTHLTSHIIQKTTPYILPRVDLYIFRYSNIGGWIDYAQKGHFKSIIFDEIQELRHGCSTNKGTASNAFAEKAILRMGLTATPIYNYGSEIYNVLDFLKPDALGTWYEFTTEWCHTNGTHQIVTDPKALGAYLREQNLFIRRTEEDVKSQMPPVNKVIHSVPYDEEVAAESEELARQLAIQVTSGSFVERGQASREFDALMRHTTGVAKARHVSAFAKMFLASGTSVLLAGWHRSVYDIWLEDLAEFDPVMFTGTESAAQKTRAKDRFISGESNLLIISLRSGSGLDGLQQRGHTIIFGELDWSPQVHHQLIGRLRRPGQKNQVEAYYVVADGGSDPFVVSTLGLKASQSKGIIDPFSGVEQKHTDKTRIRELAEQFLEKHKVPVKESDPMLRGALQSPP